MKSRYMIYERYTVFSLWWEKKLEELSGVFTRKQNARSYGNISLRAREKLVAWWTDSVRKIPLKNLWIWEDRASVAEERENPIENLWEYSGSEKYNSYYTCLVLPEQAPWSAMIENKWRNILTRVFKRAWKFHSLYTGRKIRNQEKIQ